MTLGPGEVAIVEPGTAHKFWNAGDEPVRFVCEIRPALQFESLVETMFALAADGKTNRKGMPEPVPARGDREGALRHRPPALPAGLDAGSRARGRRAARELLGYEATYEGEDETGPGPSRRRVAQNGNTRDRPLEGLSLWTVPVTPRGFGSGVSTGSSCSRRCS